MQSSLLHIFFDVETGLDYRNGDEWFMVDFLFPYMIEIPDQLKGADYFATIPTSDEPRLTEPLQMDYSTTHTSGVKNFWHHREMVRYRYGKSKKLLESLQFLDTKYRELHSALDRENLDL